MHDSGESQDVSVCHTINMTSLSIYQLHDSSVCQHKCDSTWNSVHQSVCPSSVSSVQPSAKYMVSENTNEYYFTKPRKIPFHLYIIRFNFFVTLYFDEYNNSIPNTHFTKNNCIKQIKVLIECLQLVHSLFKYNLCTRWYNS